MKRLTSILCLILVCALLFVGCGKKNDAEPSPSLSPNVTTSPDATDNGHDGVDPGDDNGVLPGDDDNGILPGDDDNGLPGEEGDSGTAMPGESPTTSPAA